MFNKTKVNQCTITLTRNCNLRCSFCYAKKTDYITNEFIEFDYVKKMVDFCDEAKSKYVILTGSHTIVNWEIAMGKRRKSLFLTLIFRPRERFFAGQQLYLLEHELP